MTSWAHTAPWAPWPQCPHGPNGPHGSPRVSMDPPRMSMRCHGALEFQLAPGPKGAFPWVPPQGSHGGPMDTGIPVAPGDPWAHAWESHVSRVAAESGGSWRANGAG